MLEAGFTCASTTSNTCEPTLKISRSPILPLPPAFATRLLTVVSEGLDQLLNSENEMLRLSGLEFAQYLMNEKNRGVETEPGDLDLEFRYGEFRILRSAGIR